MTVAMIEKEAMQLPEDQRALLADRLMESLNPVPAPLCQSWVVECDERMKAFRRGELEVLDGPSARASLRSRFHS